MVPMDKVKHFIVGVVGTIFFMAASYFLQGTFDYIAAAVLIAIVGSLKEIYDARHPKTHTADIYDFLATLAGGFFSLILYLLYGVI